MENFHEKYKQLMATGYPVTVPREEAVPPRRDTDGRWSGQFDRTGNFMKMTLDFMKFHTSGTAWPLPTDTRSLKS
jgi:hypothetical protein